MTLRADNEMQFLSPDTISEYDDNCSYQDYFALNKISIQGTRCVQIFLKGLNVQHTTIAMSSVEELLKREQLILAVAACSIKAATTCEKTYYKLVKSASIDFNKAVEAAIDNQDSIMLDIIANFTDTLNISLEAERTKGLLAEPGIINRVEKNLIFM